MKTRSGMPYDVVAYEADDLAMQLSESEEGLFHRMLRRSWMNGSIPADLSALASICRTHPSRLKKAWIKIAPLWKPHDSLPGRLINSKQERERIWVDSKTKSAKESADIRWKIQKEKEDADANALQSQSERNAFPSSPRPLPPITSEKGKEPPISPRGGLSGFMEFWTLYPRKIGKGAAEKAWGRAKVNGSLEIILTALRDQKTWHQWIRENGQYIPHPATWINQRRWEDQNSEIIIDDFEARKDKLRIERAAKGL